ncbi:MAG: glycosyltransferase 87 family protein [Candidatus Limnocylindria bacterium]
MTWVAAGVAAATVLVSAAPRLALAAGVLPAQARPFIWSDVLFTYVERLGGGRLPYWDAFFDYPPGIGYPAAAFVLLAGGPLAYTALWTLVTAASAAAVGFMLARAAGTPAALLYWSLSPQLLLLGAVNFDVLLIALLVGAVLLARSSRTHLTSVALALGAVTKVFPAAVLPLELVRVWRAQGRAAAILSAALFAATALIVLGPSLVAPFPSTLSVLNAAGRTNFDSVWGIALAGLDGIGVPQAATIVAAVSFTGLTVTYLRGVVPAARRAPDPAVGALLAIVAVLLWSRLYSPQFSLWVLPLFALAGVGVRRYALLSVADVIVFVTAFPLTLVAWGSDDLAPLLLLGGLAAGVVLRHAALILVWRDRFPRGPAATV